MRLGVNAECPEGRTWRSMSVDLCGGTGVTEVSVGPCGQVWLITWDGQTLVRTDVSCETPYGQFSTAFTNFNATFSGLITKT